MIFLIKRVFKMKETLNFFQQLHPHDSAEVFLLAIRGYCFDLDQPLTGQAEINLEQAVEYIYNRLVLLYEFGQFTFQ